MENELVLLLVPLGPNLNQGAKQETVNEFECVAYFFRGNVTVRSSKYARVPFSTSIEWP
jgi:hypothetical protein